MCGFFIKGPFRGRSWDSTATREGLLYKHTYESVVQNPAARPQRSVCPRANSISRSPKIQPWGPKPHVLGKCNCFSHTFLFIVKKQETICSPHFATLKWSYYFLYVARRIKAQRSKTLVVKVYNALWLTVKYNYNLILHYYYYNTTMLMHCVFCLSLPNMPLRAKWSAACLLSCVWPSSDTCPCQKFYRLCIFFKFSFQLRQIMTRFTSGPYKATSSIINAVLNYLCRESLYTQVFSDPFHPTCPISFTCLPFHQTTHLNQTVFDRKPFEPTVEWNTYRQTHWCLMPGQLQTGFYLSSS